MEKTNDKFIQIKKDLTECMKKEVSLMREVLANMHQEEIALVTLDKGCLNKVLQERFLLLEKLGLLRTQRHEWTNGFKSLLQDKHPGKNFPGMNIFSHDQETSCEIAYLSDQMTCLLEKMNSQNIRNESLMKKYELGFNKHSVFFKASEKEASVLKFGAKTTVKTLDLDIEEN